MGRTWWHFSASLLVLVLAALPVRGDEEPHELLADTAQRNALLHPLAHIRSRAEAGLAKDAAGEAVVRELLRDDDPRLRAGAWSVLARRPAWCRPGEARAALDDTCPRVRLQAARALLLHLTTTRLAEAPLPADMSWTPEGRQAITHALIERCEHSAADQPVPCLLRAGEGITLALGAGARTRTVPIRIRRRLLSALGRMGTFEAGNELLKTLQDPAAFPDRVHLFDTLADTHLSGAQRSRFFGLLRGGDATHLRSFKEIMRPLRWREHGPLVRALDANATATTRLLLVEHMRSVLGGRAVYPERAVDVARILVRDPDRLGDPTLVKLLLHCSPNRRWRGRDEHYGEVLRLLEPLSHRAVFVGTLTEMLEHQAFGDSETRLWNTNLPLSVEAWARFYVGEDDETMRLLATALIRGENGEVPVWEARRTGARIWHRIGPPPLPLIRELLKDADPVLRRQALAWLSDLPEEEAAAALNRARADESDGVCLAALSDARLPLGPTEGARLLDLVIRGRRSQRRAAWVLLYRAWPETVGEPAPGEGELGMDQRLRVAGKLEAHWRSEAASDAGLPNPNGR